ncbi:MAG: hypothetical protein SPD11_09965 [Sphaerochaetaceae bacterium]|nr:hypothetical protein [Sphaerochaetaceae bacterium]
MKRSLLIIGMVLLLFFVFSCDSTTSPVEKDLVLHSNVDSIQQVAPKSLASSRDIHDRIGDPIIGVLLRYHNEGSWRKNGINVVPEDPYGFYLECVYGTYTNGDGMEYNYVLFVPDCIQKAYTLSTGKDSTKNGNAFWWYMNKFLDMSYDQINANWPLALDTLLDAQKLPYPSTTETGTQGNLFERSSTGLTIPDIGSRQLDPVPVRRATEKNMALGVTDDFSLFKKSPHNGTEWSYFIFYPDIIEEEYKMVKPNYDGKSGNPFWWYISTYYDVDINDTSTDIIKAISTGTFIVPSQD